MQIKRFEASEVQEALRQVKKEFGPDAVIISIKEVEPEGIFKSLLKRKIVEVVAATENASSYYDKTNSVLKEKGNGNGNGKGNGKGNGLVFQGKTKRELFTYFEMMLAEGVEETVAAQIIKDLNFSIVNVNLEEEVKRGIIKTLNYNGMATKKLNIQKGANKRVAFLGATGVGKTSALVKLATVICMSNKYDVAIINLDNQRIGASAQLNAFGNLMGISVEDVHDKREFKQALAKYKDKDIVLIDTPGVGYKTKFMIDELEDILGTDTKIHKLFVFSAPIKGSEVLSLLDLFSKLEINGLIVTKLDEALQVGSIITVGYSSKLPLYYFSEGQEVPGSLKPASLSLIVERILYNGKREILASLSPEELAFRRKRFELLLEDGNPLFWMDDEGNQEEVFEEKSLNLRI